MIKEILAAVDEWDDSQKSLVSLLAAVAVGSAVALVLGLHGAGLI